MKAHTHAERIHPAYILAHLAEHDASTRARGLDTFDAGRLHDTLHNWTGSSIDPTVAAAVDRIISRAVWSLTFRDALADALVPDAPSVAEQNAHAHTLAAAACYAAEAGLCDIGTAIDRDAQAERAGRPPTTADYADALRAAVDQNR